MARIERGLQKVDLVRVYFVGMQEQHMVGIQFVLLFNNAIYVFRCKLMQLLSESITVKY